MFQRKMEDLKGKNNPKTKLGTKSLGQIIVHAMDMVL